MRSSLFSLWIVLFVLGLAVPAVADSFDDASEVYRSGNYKKAFELFKALADQGSAKAQYNLGVFYEEGKVVPRDYAKAVQWYRKAADQGYAPAQLNLGLMYDQGQGVSQDYTTAVKWYRKAADQGYPQAQYSLAAMYQSGDGVAKDFKKTLEWYHKAADQGYAEAQYNLGLLYAQGEVIRQDVFLAYKWLSLSVTGLPPGSVQDETKKLLEVFREVLPPTDLAQAENLVREWNAQHKKK